MKGIHCALQGRLGQDVHLSRGQRLVPPVGEGEEVTWVSVSVFEEKASALAGLTKGVEVYVRGRLTRNTWEGKDRQQCSARSGGGNLRYNTSGHAMNRMRCRSMIR